MPTEKSKAYWRERSLLLEDAQRKEASQYAETWQREFDKANARMQKELEQWYGRITDKDGNGVSLADAKRMMNKKELEEFRWTLEEYIEHARANGNLAFERELTNASAQQHIKMIEARLLALKAEGERLFTEKPLADFLSDTLQNAYDRTAFEIQIGTGEGQLMQSVNGHDLDAVMREPWQGGTFSSRIWKNKEQLIRELQKTLMQALMRGDSAFEAGKRLEKVMGTSRNNATRLVYTESAYFRERGSLKAMKELGTKTLEIIATLDMLTCKICGELDGTKVPMDTAEVGVTVPIFHPRCRCTSAPELDVALRGATERAARDPVSGKTYYVPAETTFAQWKEEQDRL
ncbi:MAG: minor capsid protein, partial [Oscillospiraceae bacterium]|nr:minor capsid protein [Oscillospiraceae bacterium]